MLFTRDTHQKKRLTQAESVKIFHASGNKQTNPAVVAILISDKVNFKTKAIIRDKEGHYITLKGSIQQEGMAFVNIYAPNIEAPKYI